MIETRARRLRLIPDVFRLCQTLNRCDGSRSTELSSLTCRLRRLRARERAFKLPERLGDGTEIQRRTFISETEMILLQDGEGAERTVRVNNNTTTKIHPAV